jgi:hypothetical protein
MTYDSLANQEARVKVVDRTGAIRRPIERVDHLTAEELENRFLKPNRPVIVSNGMKDWPALRDWTPAYFKEHHGGVVGRASYNLPDTAVPSLHRWHDHSKPMTMGEFVDLMYSCDRPCYVDSRALRFFPGEESKLKFESLTGKIRGRTLSLLWIGSKATHSGLHFDRYNNLFGQIYGEKVVCLLAPDQSRYLYQFKDVVQKSNIDPENPDLDRFPKVKQATILEATVRPGDILFIPKLWWHSLRATEHSISVNHWFGEDAALSELLPAARTSGPLSWLTIAKDFVWHGVLHRPYEQRLLSEEPNGVWLYNLAVGAVRRRLGLEKA